MKTNNTISSPTMVAPRTTAPLHLSLSVLQGEDLVAKDRDILGRKTSSDPYVVVELHTLNEQKIWTTKQLFKTKTVHASLNPVWNESFVLKEHFTPHDDADPPRLVFRIFDYDLGRKDDNMGVVTIPLHGKIASTTKWYEVPASSAKGAKGRLQVAIRTDANEIPCMVTPSRQHNIFNTNLMVRPRRRRQPRRKYRPRRRRHSYANSRKLFNVFGGDMVSKESVLAQLNQVENNKDIVCIEMEDCFASRRSDLEIAHRLKDIINQDVRPWESIHFIDEVLDGWRYAEFKHRRKVFLKALDGICSSKIIPVSYKTTIHIDDSGVERMGESSLLDLIQDLQKDASIVSLHVTSNKTSVELVNALIDLLTQDDRVWEDMTLRLTATDSSVPMTKEQRRALHFSSQRLQLAAKAQRLQLHRHTCQK